MPGGPKEHTILRTEEDISPMNRKLIDHVCHKCNFYGENQEYWESEYECAAYKFIRKASPSLKGKIKEEVLKIKDDPKIGKSLRGKLSKIRAHRFFFARSHYRIAYTVKNNLIIISVASRENFYRDLNEHMKHRLF